MQSFIYAGSDTKHVYVCVNSHVTCGFSLTLSTTSLKFCGCSVTNEVSEFFLVVTGVFTDFY